MNKGSKIKKLAVSAMMLALVMMLGIAAFAEEPAAEETLAEAAAPTSQRPEPQQPQPTQQPASTPQQPVCPNCGAPTEITSSGQCPYCGSVVTNGEHDWVLTDIHSRN